MQCVTLEMIEKIRQEMYRVASGRDLVDPEVVEVSQRLDSILNQYYHFINNEIFAA